MLDPLKRCSSASLPSVSNLREVRSRAGQEQIGGRKEIVKAPAYTAEQRL